MIILEELKFSLKIDDDGEEIEIEMTIIEIEMTITEIEIIMMMKVMMIILIANDNNILFPFQNL